MNQGNFKLMMDAYAEMIESGEIQGEVERDDEVIARNNDVVGNDYDWVLRKITPLPPEAFFLGQAFDGKPILFNVLGAQRIIVYGTYDFENIMRMNNDICFGYSCGLIRKKQWYTEEANNTLLALASWAHSKFGRKVSPSVVCMQNVELIKKQDYYGYQNFKWLMNNAKRSRISYVMQTGDVDFIQQHGEFFDVEIRQISTNEYIMKEWIDGKEQDVPFYIPKKAV